MTSIASLIGPTAAPDERPAPRRRGRPSLLNDPDHVAKRAYALHARRAGDPLKKIARDLKVSRECLRLWFRGMIGPGARRSA
jgi:hypothetical protein